MADLYKFPNGGYEVEVVKKQDILDCIDENILDKDIALEIITQLEVDAANFIKEGRWTGIPYIGNIRIPKYKLLEQSSEQKELIAEAKENLDKDKYIIFRRQLTYNNKKQIKAQRYYDYVLSMAVNHNRKLFKTLSKEKGELYARIYLYSTSNVTAVDNEYETIGDDSE